MSDKTRPIASGDLADEEKRRGRPVKVKLYFEYEHGSEKTQKVEELVLKGDQTDPLIIALGLDGLAFLSLSAREAAAIAVEMRSKSVDDSGAFVESDTMPAYFRIDRAGDFICSCGSIHHKEND